MCTHTTMLYMHDALPFAQLTAAIDYLILSNTQVAKLTIVFLEIGKTAALEKRILFIIILRPSFDPRLFLILEKLIQMVCS